MRRWAAALALALTAALAGCTVLPDGVDGDLTNAWRPPPAATQFRPAAGTCHADLRADGDVEDYTPIPCTGPHVAESVAVADLVGAQSLATSSAALPRAYAQCSRLVSAFLGADWRTGWVITQPVLPGKGAWSSGARWVRCDVGETSPIDGALVRRTATMKDGLKPGGQLLMSCANPKIQSNRVTEMHSVACTAKHTSEFAGLFESKRTSSAQLTTRELEKGCDATIAKFAGIPADGTVANRVGWLGFPPDDTAWDLGDHAVRCFLWLNGEQMTGSYRNAGRGKLKIHYTN
jgi:hypothetical protein